MKRALTFMAAVLLTVAATAQTLNVKVGQVTYQFPASDDEMTFTDGGSTLTIQNKAFTLSDITSMTVDDTEVTDGAISVTYNGTTASVTVAGNIAQYVTPTVSGAHVSIAQNDDLAEEITYTLSGTSTDGEFYMSGSYKATVELNGLTLTNTTPVYSGAAVHIQNGKRIKVKVVTGTTNTLVDAASGSQKGCLYIKGHAEFAQKGTLNVTGNVKHAIKTGEYMTLKNATINVLGAVGDGISCNEYFLMESGIVKINNTQDDGIQCDLDGTESTGETTDHEAEDSGNIYIQGGTVNVSVTADAAKAIKAEGDISISGGTITCTTSGNGIWDSDKVKTKASTCISADGNMTITGGTLTLTSTGHGGKGISVDGDLEISGGTITVTTSGGKVVYRNNTLYNGYTGDERTIESLDSDYKSSPKGIKADGNVTITGGTITVSTSGMGGEGIESKKVMTIDGTAHITCNTYDDGLNSSSHMYVKGGYIYTHATNNDGLDANGNLEISGGLIYAIGASSPEVALDAAEQYQLKITGGTIIAIGGLESGYSLTNMTAKKASSWSKGAWYALYNGSTLVGTFKTPTGSTGSDLVVVTSGTPAMKSGCTISGGTEYFGGMAKLDATVSGGSNVTLSNYSSSGDGGGGQPGGGPR